MNNLFRGLIAGYGAHKLGGGCISTILIFIVIWVLLGQCGAAMPPLPEPVAAKVALVGAAPVKPLHVKPLHATPLTVSPMAAGRAAW